MSISRRGVIASAGLVAMSIPVLAHAESNARVATPKAAYEVVRLASWDDMPAQSVFINPYDMAVHKADSAYATGELTYGRFGMVTNAAENALGVTIPVYVDRDHTFTGEAVFIWRRKAVDLDGQPLDVKMTVFNVRTYAWSGGQAAPTSRQVVVYSRDDQSWFNLSSEWGNDWAMGVPQRVSIRIELTRQDGSPALGTMALAFRDVDINSAYRDEYSEGIRPISGFANKVYVLANSWLNIDTATGRVWENSQGTNYTQDPRETVVYTTNSHIFEFEWTGHICGTVMFDSMKSEVNIPVRKVWDGGAYARPSSVTVTLNGSDASKRTATLNAGNNWSHTFSDLPLMVANKAVTYSVTETTVPDFESSITGNAASGFVITNRYTKGTARLNKKSREKTWV